MGLRGHGEAALGLEEGEQLEPEGLGGGEVEDFFFKRERKKAETRRERKEKKTQSDEEESLSRLSFFPLTCAPARSPLRSACSAPKSSERRRSPLAARPAAEEDDDGEE